MQLVKTNKTNKRNVAFLAFCALTSALALPARAVDSEIVTAAKGQITNFTADLTSIGIAVIGVAAVAAVIMLAVKWMKKH